MCPSFFGGCHMYRRTPEAAPWPVSWVSWASSQPRPEAGDWDDLVYPQTNKKLWKITIFNRQIIHKWGFSTSGELFFGSQPNSCEGRRKINSPCYENGFLVISKSPSTIAEILEMWLSTWEPGLTKWRCDNGRYQQHHPIVFFQRGAPNIWQSNNGEHEVLNPWIFWVSWYQHQIYIYIYIYPRLKDSGGVHLTSNEAWLAMENIGKSPVTERTTWYTLW